MTRFLFLAFLVLSFTSMLGESVTVDEFAHLPAGYSYLKTGEFHLYNRNPPLIKMLAATPLLMQDVAFSKTPNFEKQDHWMFGYDFMYANQAIYKKLFASGRMVIILIGLLGGYLVFLWAKDLYGYAAGCLALFLYSLCPNILAHSHLVTMDLGLSVFMLAALYFFYRFIKQGTWVSAAIAGVFLGIAQLTKFTALVLYPVIMIYFLIFCLKKNKLGNSLGKMVLILALSVLVLNAGYLFDGSFTPVKDFQFESKLMQGISQKLPQGLPLPLPFDYICGFDLQNNDTEGTFFQFLMGESSVKGWWHYYLIAFLFKVPLAFIVLLLLLAILRIKRKLPPLYGGEKLIFLGVLAYFLTMSFVTKLNAGIRYVLPILPLLYVFSSRVILVKLKPVFKFSMLCIIVLVYAAESLYIYPHYLSFFNLLAGGPKNGYHYLIDSNIDWGQDLPLLKKYMVKNRVDTIDLAYFGRVDPRVYGINYRVLEPQVRGVNAAVSINYYQGYPYFILKGRKLDLCPPDYYSYLRKYHIKERIGYSILIVEIPEQ